MNDLALDLDETLTIGCHLLENIEACADFLLPTHNFKTLTLNIRSIQHNFDAFLVILKRSKVKFDLIVLTECWLNENTFIPHLPGFTAFHTIKYINKSGGVVAYVGDSWNVQVDESTCEDCNCLEINFGAEFVALAIYRSPSFLNPNNFILSLDSTLTKFRNKKNIILTGDINIDLCADPMSEHCSNYVSLLTEHQLLPAIHIPTRGDACLDHSFLRNPRNALGLVCVSDLTDHYICVAAMSTRQPKPTIKHYAASICFVADKSHEKRNASKNVSLGADATQKQMAAFGHMGNVNTCF
ncbi:hypothetical protein ACJJTC_013523 [Scirpophaga incertulas]